MPNASVKPRRNLLRHRPPLPFAGTALLLFALLAGPQTDARAQETGENGDETPEAPGKTDEETLKEWALQADLVVAARPVGVKRCDFDGSGNVSLRMRFSVERVLKGVLGSVKAFQVPVGDPHVETFQHLVEGILENEPPLTVLFLESIDRYRLPPLYRFAAPPQGTGAAESVESAVMQETLERIQDLDEDNRARRDTAFKKLVELGTPAVRLLEAAQRGKSARVAEEARLAILSINRLRVDPFRIYQPNRRYPHEPVTLFDSPESKKILFRLPPGTRVFRLNTWDDSVREIYKVRTMDGREGWVDAKSCVPEDCETWE